MSEINIKLKTYEQLQHEIIQLNTDKYMLQQENKQLKEVVEKRERKWEKWSTEKGILSSKMSEYLCKYQNIKREYTNQNNCLHKYKTENTQLKSVLKEIREFINISCSWLNIDLRDNDELLHVRAKFFKELLEIIDKGSDTNEL